MQQREVLLVGLQEDPDRCTGWPRVASGWSASTSEPGVTLRSTTRPSNGRTQRRGAADHRAGSAASESTAVAQAHASRRRASPQQVERALGGLRRRLAVREVVALARLELAGADRLRLRRAPWRARRHARGDAQGRRVPARNSSRARPSSTLSISSDAIALAHPGAEVDRDRATRPRTLDGHLQQPVLVVARRCRSAPAGARGRPASPATSRCPLRRWRPAVSVTRSGISSCSRRLRARARPRAPGPAASRSAPEATTMGSPGRTGRYEVRASCATSRGRSRVRRGVWTSASASESARWASAASRWVSRNVRWASSRSSSDVSPSSKLKRTSPTLRGRPAGSRRRAARPGRRRPGGPSSRASQLGRRARCAHAATSAADTLLAASARAISPPLRSRAAPSRRR